MHKLALLALACFVTIGFAQEQPTTLMEAKLYIKEARDLDRLGNLAGDLYICSRGADDNGAYLVLVTDAEQLAAIRETGLNTRVTWANLDDKFKLLTGVDPKDAGRFQDFGYYYTYWEMRDSLQAFAAAYPGICSLFVIGTTSLGRSIFCLKVSDRAGVEEDEPACYFSGACHGDEPMGTSIAMAFLRDVLTGYGHDPATTWLVDNREIYTVPILNPDCSVYCSDSGGAGVYWRKNRRIVVPPNIGVDPSRNHGYKWGYDDVGSSPNPAAHAYRGPFRWSDAEAAAARDLSLTHRFRTEQDFHCYGRYNMYPWSWTTAAPPDQAALREANDSLQVYNGYPLDRTGQISVVLYACNGTQPDWALTDTAGKFPTYAFDIEADTWFYACWNDSALMRQEVDGNVPGLYYLARIAGVYFDSRGVVVDDSALGNSSGRLDPGETADIWFTVRNRAIHPFDSAYSISARLVSLDTLVEVLDSLKPFPNARRRSNTDNRADKFRVRASVAAPGGDTVQLRLDAAFYDAGQTILMPVSFTVVLGDNPVGIDDGGPAGSLAGRIGTSVVGSVLLLPDRPGTIAASVLLNALGRRVLDLRPGPNDVSRLAPGVYFAVTGDSQLSRRVVLLR